MTPRSPIHVGSVECAGFLLDVELLGEARVRERIIERWRPGTRVHRSALGVVVRSPQASRTMTTSAIGLPLASRSSGSKTLLCSAPLADEELGALDAEDGDVVVVRGGAIRVLHDRDMKPIDVAAWLALPAIRVAAVEPLGQPAEAVALALAPVADSRALFEPVIGETPPDIRAMREAIARQEGKPGHPPAWFSRFVTVARGVLREVRRVATRRKLVVTPATPGVSWLDRISAAIRSAFARALLRSKLGEVFARKQAEYVGETLEMLERGDYEEALRRAIPLGSATERPAPPTLGLPSRRHDLAISPTTTRASSSVVIDAHEILRRAYRAAFERLVKQRRIDEAAFVLAELLHADEEAVSFLETHGRLVLAAQIAEARGMSPDLVVRQWFVAGDRHRAITLAKVHGAFHGAVARLEHSGRAEEANALRLLWADALADKGEYAGAVTIAWPLAEAQPTIRRWIHLGMAQGGETGATMVARHLLLERDVTSELRAAVLEVLEDASDEGPYRRAAFARALAAAKQPSDGVRTFARAAMRALFADAPRDGLEAELAGLRKLADDGALRADEPRVPRPVRRAFELTKPRVAPPARMGLSQVHDAAVGTRGRIILALGELGVRVIDKDQRVVAAFTEPAHALAVSDSLDRVIGLGARGGVARLARIDVTRRLSERWCDVRVRMVDKTFDGWMLFAIDHDDELVVLDATDAGISVVRRVPDIGQVVAFARAPSSCAIVVFHPAQNHAEILRFELPSWTLRQRKPVEPERLAGISVLPNGRCACIVEYGIEYDSGGGPVQVKLAGVEHVLAGDAFIAIVRRVEEGMLVSVMAWGGGVVNDALLLGGATRVGLRRGPDDSFVVFDDMGRVFVIDAVTGRSRGEWLS